MPPACAALALRVVCGASETHYATVFTHFFYLFFEKFKRKYHEIQRKKNHYQPTKKTAWRGWGNAVGCSCRN